jgi:6-phosphogluconolactonase
MTASHPRAHDHLSIFAEKDALMRAAADLFVRASQQAAVRGRFTVALSGGSTPRALHTLLAAPPYRDQINWSRIEFFWGDERFVPPDDPESNYRMARETLLERVPVQPSQIHPVPTQLGDPAATAVAYTEELRRVFRLGPDDLPPFDLILLGMGPDGHTASLFPHTAALHAHDRLVVANAVPQLQTYRITLTASVINHAGTVAFLISGADKADALHAVLEGPRDVEMYPSQLIAPTTGELHWLVDRAAAAKLTT